MTTLTTKNLATANALSLRDRLLTPPKDVQNTTTASSSSSSRIYLLDGGVSTHLRDLWQRDFPHPELWSSSLLLTEEGRSTILQGHKDWLRSGSDVLTTVTYQCFFPTLSARGGVVDASQVDRMLRDGVQLARRAILEEDDAEKKASKGNTTTTTRKQQRFVVASMGCYGAALADGSEYTGNYPNIQSDQDLVDFHRAKTQILLEEQPDGFALETVPCVQECRAFLSLLQELSQTATATTTKQPPLLPACWISLACRNGHELNDGSPLEEALNVIHELDPEAALVQAIGINCCDSEHIASLVRTMVTFLAQTWQPQSRRALVIYPNSGEEWNPETKSWKEGTGLRQDNLQDVFAVRLLEAVDMAQEIWKQFHPTSPPPTILLGGCCRTRPETIRALRIEVNRRHERHQPLEKTSRATSKKPPTTPTASARDTAGATVEQQRRIDQLLQRDAELDRQIGGINNNLQELVGTQQRVRDAVEGQSSVLKDAEDKFDGK